MAITLHLPPDEEALVRRPASRLKITPEDYVRRKLRIGTMSSRPRAGETHTANKERTGAHADMEEHLREIGVLGAVRGTQREDDRPWSEVEAASDPR